MTTQSTNKPRLGILMCGHSPEKVIEQYGRFDDIFKQLLGPDHFDYVPYFAVDGELPDSVNDADAWLLTGSKHGAYEALPWIPPLEAFVRDIYAQGLPMVGICFGHQLIAQALGGKVVKFDGGWVAGTEHYELSEQTGVGSAVLNAWHQHAALYYRDNTVSIQPHPEFENDYLQLLLAERGTALPADIQQAAADSLGQNLNNKAIGDWLRTALTS